MLPAVALWLPSFTQTWSLTSDSPWSTQSAPVATSELFFALSCFPLAFLPLACFPLTFCPSAFCPLACFPLAVFPLACFSFAFLLFACFPLAFFPLFQLSNPSAACSSKTLCCIVIHHSAVSGLAMHALACCSQLQAEIMTLYLAIHVTGSLPVHVDVTSRLYKYMLQLILQTHASKASIPAISAALGMDT